MVTKHAAWSGAITWVTRANQRAYSGEYATTSNPRQLGSITPKASTCSSNVWRTPKISLRNTGSPTLALVIKIRQPSTTHMLLRMRARMRSAYHAWNWDSSESSKASGLKYCAKAEGARRGGSGTELIEGRHEGRFGVTYANVLVRRST